MKFFILIVLFLTSFHSNALTVFVNDDAQIHPSSVATSPDTIKARNITYKIINGINQTYGYDIYVDGKIMFHQPSIPCLPGLNGFKKRKDAKNIALLVITKIKNGMMPPTITKEEMEKAGVSLK
jgi:hypothetical protein